MVRAQLVILPDAVCTIGVEAGLHGDFPHWGDAKIERCGYCGRVWPSAKVQDLWRCECTGQVAIRRI